MDSHSCVEQRFHSNFAGDSAQIGTEYVGMCIFPKSEKTLKHTEFFPAFSNTSFVAAPLAETKTRGKVRSVNIYSDPNLLLIFYDVFFISR
jgi:hypothetical protein